MFHNCSTSFIYQHHVSCFVKNDEQKKRENPIRMFFDVKRKVPRNNKINIAIELEDMAAIVQRKLKRS